jgi:hypothetical protein
MSYSIHTEIGTGVPRVYDLQFEYLHKDHVSVYAVELDLITDPEVPAWVTTQLNFTWESETTIEVLDAELNKPFFIQRQTPRDELWIPWEDGAILHERNLQDAHLQHLYIAQEMDDGFIFGYENPLDLPPELVENALQRVGGRNLMEQKIDMGLNRIVHLGVPIEDDDAVRLQDVPVLNGEDLVVETREEKILLTDGQTTVTLVELTARGAAVYIGGDNIDRGRLVDPIDFSTPTPTTIELTNSYPAGSILTVVQNEGSAEITNDARVRDFLELILAIGRKV